MSKAVNLSDFESVIAEVIENDSQITLTASGSSMEPLIHNGKDNVILKKPDGKIRKGDIVFYKRGNGKLVLHRVVGKDENGYIMCGDNQWKKEYGIDGSQIIAVLDSVEKNGRKFSSDGLYLKAYKIFLPQIKWERRIRNSISIRLKGDNKK